MEVIRMVILVTHFNPLCSVTNRIVGLQKCVWIAQQARVIRGVKCFRLMWWILCVLELDLHYWCAHGHFTVWENILLMYSNAWVHTKVHIHIQGHSSEQGYSWKECRPKCSAVTVKAWLVKFWNMLKQNEMCWCAASVHSIPKFLTWSISIPTMWTILNNDLLNCSAMTSVWMKRTSSVEAWRMCVARLLRLVFLNAGFIVMTL
jgi:hypothetical protein